MLAYLILLAFPIIMLIPFGRGNRYSNSQIGEKNERAILVFFIILILLVGFRSENLGADTQQYKYHFQQISLLRWTQLTNYGYEIGFVVLNKLISSIFHDFRWMMIIMALLSYIPVLYVYKEHPGNAYLKIILFANFGFLFGAFSGGRQSVANGIILFSYFAIRDRRLVKFALLVFIAFLFHRSALIAGIIYPIYYFKVKKIYFPFIIILLVLVNLFKAEIYSLLIYFADEKFVSRYFNLSETGAYMMFAFLALLTVYSFLFSSVKFRISDSSGLLNILIVATLIQLFASISHGISRLNEYFIIFIPILIPIINESPSSAYNSVVKIVTPLLEVALTIYLLYSLLSDLGSLYNIYPYQFLG